LDARLLAGATSSAARVDALAHLRSRRGFEAHLQRGHLRDAAVVREALGQAVLAITQAYLLPAAPDAADLRPKSPAIEPLVVTRLRRVPLGSPLHLTLAEAARRQYRLAAQSADRENKEAIRAALNRPPTAG